MDPEEKYIIHLYDVKGIDGFNTGPKVNFLDWVRGDLACITASKNMNKKCLMVCSTCHEVHMCLLI